MGKVINCNMIAIKRDNMTIVGAAWNDLTKYPDSPEDIYTRAWTYETASTSEAVKDTESRLAQIACSQGWDNCTIFVDRNAAPYKLTSQLGNGTVQINVIEGVVSADGLEENSPDPQKIRARAARLACVAKLDEMRARQKQHGHMTVIITAGPTNERIDAVMKITNMSTGSLGKKIAETMLNVDGNHDWCAEQIDKIYYISPKLAYKPIVPDAQAHKLQLIQIESAVDLLDEITRICKQERVDVIVHSSAVGDYTAKYTARAEDLVAEIVRRQNSKGLSLDENELMEIFENPPAALNDETKMSSYEPHMMTMMKLTPKIISQMRRLAPEALIFGFKLLENVSEDHLFGIASALRKKNQVNYIIANDLAKIGNGRHPAMFIGYDNFQETDVVKARCETKQGIANQICTLAFGSGPDAVKYIAAEDKPGQSLANPDNTIAGKTYWHVIAANNMNTNVRIEGFAGNKADAWKIMAAEFKKTASQMVPDVAVPEAEYLDMEQGFEFDDDGERRVSITAEGAQVFDGDDMWYYSLVPMSYVTVDREDGHVDNN